MNDERPLRATLNPSPSPFDEFLDVPDFPDAVCAQTDPDLWFPETATNSGRSVREIEATQLAVEMCQTCPHMDDCADYALSRRIPYGVFGGLSKFDRETIWQQDEEETEAGTRVA
jgi:WhiB family redox-sensing transcriptional regulator